jgi:hypothetical protein
MAETMETPYQNRFRLGLHLHAHNTQLGSEYTTVARLPKLDHLSSNHNIRGPPSIVLALLCC